MDALGGLRSDQKRSARFQGGSGATRLTAKRWWRRPALAAWLALLGLTPACGGDNLHPPPPLPDRELYWSLDLNHHAVMMSLTAPYDTLQLVATPHNRHGEALPNLGTPHFTSPNQEVLLVSPEGLLIAKAPVSEPLPVIATLTTGNLKHEDTVYVVVVDNPTPPVLTSFSVHPLPPDSAKVGMASYGIGVSPEFYQAAVLPVRARDADDNPIDGIQASFRSSDPTVLVVHKKKFGGDGVSVAVENGTVEGIRPGLAAIYASTTAFGITKADTVPYRIGWPTLWRISLSPTAGGFTFNPAEVTVGVGAMILWNILTLSNNDPVDLTFADGNLSTAGSPLEHAPWMNNHFVTDQYCSVADCNNGNATGRLAIRVFSSPGIYEYRSNSYGISGRIVVVDESH